jgi:hypothetical protein
MAETEDRSLQLHALIVSKGNEIRALKAAKITKAELKPHVVELLGLKVCPCCSTCIPPHTTAAIAGPVQECDWNGLEAY